MAAEQQYIDLYSQCEALVNRHASDVLNAPRAKALADFKAAGFPKANSEDYKYTDVAQAFTPDFGLNRSPASPATARRPGPSPGQFGHP